MTQKTKIAVIGTGRMGSVHVRNIARQIPEADLVAICDLRLEAAQPLADELGIARVVKDYHELLGDPKIEAVLIAASTPAHAMIIKDSAAAGKHIFCEKPHGLDVPGLKMAMAANEEAKKKGLAVLSGLCWRFDVGVQEAMKRVHDGQIGDIVAAQVYWNQGDLWVRKQETGMSDMEWQCRNWLYFSWLSGDHIVEQHVHDIDVANWMLRAHPVRANGMGGRQVRIGPQYGEIFDHHAVEFEYADPRTLSAMSA